MQSSVKRVTIIDLAYPVGANSRGVSAQWLAWACSSAGLVVVDSDPQIILATSVSPVDAPKIEKAKKRFCRPVIVGGAGALSPASYLKHGADAVVLGDGTGFLAELAAHGIDSAMEMDNCMTNSRPDPSIDQSFDYLCPAFTSEDGVKRLIVSRGCKHKCLFCHTSWALRFSEHGSPWILEDVARVVASSHKIGYITNDIGQHAFMKSLPPSIDGSFSLDYLRKSGVPVQRQIRLGVEGVSERLRKYVHKPISAKDLVNCTAWLNSNGKNVRWFLIAGLPTESDSDWEELRESVNNWKRICQKGVLELSFTAWCPDPSTPLAIMPIDDGYWDRFLLFKRWFFEGAGWSHRVKLYAPQQPRARLEKAIYSMCSTETQLRRGGASGGNRSVKYPYKDVCESMRGKLSCRN